MIKVHEAADGTKSFQVYGRARIREKSVRVYVGSFASQKQAEAADEQHRVTQRAIKAGDLPAAVDHKRTLSDALDAWLKAIKDQRSHDEYESRMRLYVRPTFDRTPLVKITKPKLLDLRTSLKEREEPIGNATLNTLFASLSAAYSYFIEQGWCSENPLKFIRDLEVAERPFLWLQSAGEVQKLLSVCNDNIRTLIMRSKLYRRLHHAVATSSCELTPRRGRSPPERARDGSQARPSELVPATPAGGGSNLHQRYV